MNLGISKNGNIEQENFGASCNQKMHFFQFKSAFYHSNFSVNIIIGTVSTMAVVFIILFCFACYKWKKLTISGQQQSKNISHEMESSDSNRQPENPYDEYHVYDTLKVYEVSLQAII